MPRIANFTPFSASLTGTDLTEPVRGEVVSPEYFQILEPGRRSGGSSRRRRIGCPAHTRSRSRLTTFSSGARAETGGDRHDHRDRSPAAHHRRRDGAGFRGLSDAAELWVPTMMAPALSYDEYLTTDQSFISLVARLEPGSDLEALRSELAAVVPAIARALPTDDDEPTSEVSATAVPLSRVRVAPELRRAAWLLLAAVGVLHLMACANAVNLLLGRAVGLRRDAAIRASLGCGAGRLLRHYWREVACFAGTGALGGLLLAWAASGLVVPLNAWGPRNYYGSIATFSDPSFGLRALLFWLLVALVTVIVVSWPPAAATVWGDPSTALWADSRTVASGRLSLRRPTARGAIVALEAALALTLLAVGGLMIETFVTMRRTALGVEPERVLTFALRPAEVEETPETAARFIDGMLAAVTTAPGVISASVDGGAPLSGSATSTLRIVGRPEPPSGAGPSITRHYVGPDHFRTLGIPLVAGRAFDERDRAGQPGVAIVSESAARRFWPRGDAIGQRVWFGAGPFDRPDSSVEIVGIVGDVPYQPLDRDPIRASFYTPYRQFTYANRTYFVRTEGPPAAAVSAIREAIHAVDPNVPMIEVRPLDRVIDASWSRNRFDALFYGGFGLLSLVLACTGIYAVVSYAVSQRLREMAIRLAVGAEPLAVFRLVVIEGMSFPLLGLAVGALATVGATRLARAAVVGAGDADPTTLAGAALLLATAAFLASALPARRAMRVAPQEVLRAE
ncbi:MAG: FtsX-like permease family protein [Gemmatimonadales bacterium]